MRTPYDDLDRAAHHDAMERATSPGMISRLERIEEMRRMTRVATEALTAGDANTAAFLLGGLAGYLTDLKRALEFGDICVQQLREPFASMIEERPREPVIV